MGRMMKKTAEKAIALLLLVLMLMPLAQSARAAELYHMEIEQINTSLPKIVAYLQVLDEKDQPYLNGRLSETECAAALDGKGLEVVSLELQSDSDCGVNYYYLLDTSSSVSAGALRAVKTGIVEHIESKDPADRIAVITFGKAVNVALDGTESSEEAEKILRDIQPTESGTRLYDAIAKAVELADAVDDQGTGRPVLVLATDGVDENTGGNSEQEALDILKNHGLPIYALGYSGSSTRSLNALGEFARASGGNMQKISGAGAVQTIRGLIESVENTYRLECRADSNNLRASTGVLSIQTQIDGRSYSASGAATFRRWIRDDEPPVVDAAEVTGKNTLEIRFSENVAGAETASAYLLQNDRGQTIHIANASYDGASCMAVLTTEQVLYRGSYTLRLVGVHDVSNEENAAQDSFAFRTDTIPKGLGYYAGHYFYIPLIPLVIAAAFLGYRAAKRKRQPDSPTESGGVRRDGVYLPQVDGQAVEITVIDAHRMERKVSAYIGGAYIIGRDADVCDLAVEDKRLSRQHCALTYENGILRIQDLQSTNGTRVNGVRITQPRDLSDSDVVEIANTKLRIRRR